ncbi:MAG: ATP-binding cassette domain-containing protein [Armatimonadota bacterium]
MISPNDILLNGMALIRLENVGRRLDGKWALWDVSIAVDRGDLLGILGRPGSGKTVLARVLAGLDYPAHGTITRGDIPDARSATSEQAIPEAQEHSQTATLPVNASLAFESPALATELTIYENLALFASLWGTPKRTLARKIAFLLELVGLGSRHAARPGQLSAGEARQAEIARALAAETPVTVIDCLTDALDKQTLERLCNYMLAERRDRGRAFVLMTRSARVAGLCGRTAVLHNGRIAFLGRPDDLRRLAGEDIVVLSEIRSPALRKRIEERLAVVIKEEDGFLSFRVANGERMIADLLAEFGAEVGCVYLKRPTLDDALDALAGGSSVAVASQAG